MGFFTAKHNPQRKSKVDDIAVALHDWQRSIKYFESVRDPELVDFAIYEMEAAKRKYIFLLKRKGGRHDYVVSKPNIFNSKKGDKNFAGDNSILCGDISPMDNM